MKIRIIVLLILSISTMLSAQEKDSLKTSIAQVTFGYPVGSKGIYSKEYSNNFSLNILHGINGGLNGAEIGSILNYNKGDVKGFQVAGISNITNKNSKGCIIAGIANVSNRNSSGCIISGIANVSNRNSSGSIISGITNVTSDTCSGIAISGVYNSAKSSRGIQLSTINVIEQTITGIQIGVVNSNSGLEGVQIGVVNVFSSTENSFPVGLINIAKNGYYAFELMGSESIYANVSFKMGSNRLYTIYKYGFATYKNNNNHSIGIGIGTKIPLKEKHSINIDATFNTISNKVKLSEQRNNLSKLDINYRYCIGKYIEFVAGPSLNVYTTDHVIDSEIGTIKIPYNLLPESENNVQTSMWIGFNAGLSFTVPRNKFKN